MVTREELAERCGVAPRTLAKRIRIAGIARRSRTRITPTEAAGIFRELGEPDRPERAPRVK